MYTNKEKKLFHCFLWQTGAQPSLGEQGAIMCHGYLGRQTPALQMSPCSSYFPLPYILSILPYGLEHPFGQLSQLPMHLQPPC